MAFTEIDRPDLYFNTVLYTGNNGSNRSITGVGFQPSLVWNKNRSASANHNLWNEVTGITERLTSSGTQASEDYSSEFLSFDSDGVTITQNVASLDINNSSYNYVNWNWLASNTTASNTDGSITSSVSANTTAGFSIATWSGTGASATIGHGLGASPELSFIKQRTGTQDWSTQATVLGYSKYLILNGTMASTNTSGALINSVSSTTISVDSNAYVNGSGSDYVGYFFSSIKGYSKIGSYTGNGSADGTFVYTGLSPSFVLLKETSNANNWMIFDNKRSPFNLRDDFISPDISDAEFTGNANNRMDMLSNGFKIRGTGSATNRSGSNFIYMAFAESPFTTSTGIPTTAR